VIVQPPPAVSVTPPARARVQPQKTVKVKTRPQASKPKLEQPKPTLPAPSARGTGSSAPDSTLMIGGLALVVLVLGDTIFLALSARLLRPG
jgi:hypothetical protein